MRRASLFLGMAALLAVPLGVGAAGQAAGEGSAAMDDLSNHLEISWLGNPAEKPWWQGELERMFNVTIVPNGVGKFQVDKQQIIVAAGEMPDTGVYFVDSKVMYQDGVIRSAPESMFREYAPNYVKAVDSAYPAAWKVHRAPDKPDEHYGWATIRGGSIVGNWLLAFRKDWADAVGVSMPGDYEGDKVQLDEKGKMFYYDHPAMDIDWLEGLMVAFRDGDPDGNGKTDTLPYGGFYYADLSFSNFGWATIQGAFGVGQTGLQGNQLIDGQVVHNFVGPGLRAFTKQVARWWEMGLIDNESLTQGVDPLLDKQNTGRYGVVMVNTPGIDRGPNGPPDSMISDEDFAAGGELVLFAPRGPEGHQFAPTYGITNIGDNIPQVWEKSISDAKVTRVMQILDTKAGLLDFTPEAIANWAGWAYGKEGVHWNWGGEPGNSSIVRVAQEDVPAEYSKRGSLWTNYPNFNPRESGKFSRSPNVYTFYEEYLYTDEIWSKMARPYKWDSYKETDIQEVMKQRGAALNTLASEWFAKAVTGEIDVDATWDEYVQDFMRFGGSEILAEMEKMPTWDEVWGTESR